MQTVYIKFPSEESRVKGFYELIKSARVASFPGKIYQIPFGSLKILESMNIPYRRATDDEVKQAHDQIRDPSAPAHQGNAQNAI